MFWRFCLILFIGVLLEWKLTQCAPAEVGKTKEKVRAYEFGFSIEEQQHRHEKRDENGIVMGEFGFITADGIYHVTVYATDENGKFKIISMKNYPYGNPEKKIMIAMIPPMKKLVVTPTVVKAGTPDKSCGGCVLPKKFNLLPADVKGKKPSDGEKIAFRPLSKALNDESAGKTNGGTQNRNPGSKPISSLPPGVVATGKGSSASQQPSSKPPGSQPLIPPKLPTNGAALSKVKPGTPTNGGNKYQFQNLNTQTTPTQTPFSTQISRKNSEKTKFDGIQNPGRRPEYTPNQIPQLIDSVRKATHTLLPTQKFKNGQSGAVTPIKPTEINARFGFSNQGKQNARYLTPTGASQASKLPNSFINSNYPFRQNGPTVFNTNAKSTLGFPGSTILPTKSTLGKSFTQSPGNSETLSINKNNPINMHYGTGSNESKVPKTLPGRNSPPGGNIRDSNSVPLPNRPKNLSGSPIYNTNITPQQFSNSHTQTIPTRTLTFPSTAQQNERFPLSKTKITNTTPAQTLTRFTGNSESKTVPQTNTRLGSQFTPSLQKTSTPNVSQTPNYFNTISRNSNSLTTPNNPTNPFAIPARTTSQQQNGQKTLPNVFTQNTARPILKSIKEPKPFQSLSKILPEQKNGITTPVSQIPLKTPTSKQIPPLTRNTAVPKTGTSPTFVAATPQSINTNKLTQPKLTANSLTPKRLQQNTNEARTTTDNIPSTNKLTPGAPSSQSTGKVNSPSNVGGGGGNGSGGAAGSGGGPLYRFNYVLDYNSHREEGRIDGSKEGKYNTIGEDGIRRIIDYIANENGYQPHIKLQRLPPNELPTGENKLKEYEFVWFN